jgi:predicted peptidase
MMTRFHLLLALLGAAAALAHAPADDRAEQGFVSRVYKGADGAESRYVVFVPHGYTPDKAYPVVLFLHGSGSTGDDGKKQVSGIAAEIRKAEKAFPAVVVFPQSQKRTWRANSEDGKRAMAILAEVEKTYKTDPKRVYLTGLSMGGFGTWSLAAAHPDRWAAIVPICGGGNPADAAKIKDLPCWCFHGDADPTVKVDGSRNMVKAVKDAGGSPKYTEYPGVGHNSWTKAYATKELYDWLWEQKRK